MSTQNLVEKLWNKGRIEGRIEGRKEGRIEGARTALCTILAKRKLVPTREEQARINACRSVVTLRRWHAQAVVAQNVTEALMTTRRTAPRQSRIMTTSAAERG